MLEKKINQNTGLAKTPFQRFKTELSKNKTLFLMLLPSVILVFLLSYIPMGGVILAFKNFKFNLGIFKSPWVGFDNFKFLLDSGKLWSLTYNTLVYNIIFIVVGIVAKILMAVLIYEMMGKYYKRVLQSVMILPYFLSWVIIGGLAYNMLNYEFGTINNMLGSLGFERWDVYNQPGAWKYIFTAVTVWHDTGYGMIFYLAALTGINPELYEAAYLDGAGLMKRIRYVTIPLILPTTLILFLLGLSGILKGNLDMFYQLVGDNTNLFEATDVIDTYVFRNLTTLKDYTVTSAAGLYQNFIGCVLVITVNAIVKRIDADSALY